jgi:hypothetical protein
MSPVVAHRVDSLRCEGSDAVGAKRTCRERRERVDLTKMTHLYHSTIDFAVAHKSILGQPLVICDPEAKEGSA